MTEDKAVQQVLEANNKGHSPSKIAVDTGFSLRFVLKVLSDLTDTGVGG